MKKILQRWFSSKKEERLRNLSEQEKGALHQFAEKLNRIQKKDYPSFETLLWDLYPQFVKLGTTSQKIDQDSDYAKKGYKQGLISSEPIEHFKSLLKTAKTYAISHDDFDVDYITHPDLHPYEKDLNASHRLFVLDDKLLNAMKPILKELKEPIAKCLGSPWKIINVLCWETFPEALEEGPNAWHRDGLPFAVNKVMIYLNGASAEKGTTTLKFDDETTMQVEGPAGTWLLFKISEILHKGEKPKKDTRIVLEIRVIPSFEFDLRPYSAGFNAHYPKYPWHELKTSTSALKQKRKSQS